MSGFINKIQRTIAAAGQDKGEGDRGGVVENIGQTIRSALPKLVHGNRPTLAEILAYVYM
jgi:hypothetical protein